MTEAVTTTHLVMDSPSALRAKQVNDESVAVTLVTPPNPQLNHALFMEIGTPFRWYSRLDWRHGDWERYARDPTVQTWLGARAGSPFGYYELQSRTVEDGASGRSVRITEIVFFGVFAAVAGQGLGAHLLTHAVRSAWQTPGTERVYVHTCSSDHPGALNNYVSRGFVVQRTETLTETIPDPDDPVWCSPLYYRTMPSASSQTR